MAAIDMTYEDVKKKRDPARAGSAGIGGWAPSLPSIASGLPGADYAGMVGDQVRDAYRQGGAPAALGAVGRGAIGAPLAVSSDVSQGAQSLGKSALGAIDQGISYAGRALDPAATALRTMVTGDATPIRDVMARDSAASISAALPAPAAQPRQAPAAAAASAYPAAGAIPASGTSGTPGASGTLGPPAGIGDLTTMPSGTGMIRNNRTGKVTAIDSGQPQQPMMQIARTTPAISPAAAAAANEQIALYNDLMARPDGGIGAGLVARGALNKAKAFSGIDAEQNAGGVARANAGTNSQRAGIDAFSARSQDEARRSEMSDRAATRADADKVRGLRDQYLALDDKLDPEGKQRAALKSKLDALTGKDNDRFVPTYNVDPVTGEKTPTGSFDAKSGIHLGLDGKPAKVAPTVPAGMKQVGTANGIPVYEDGKGNRFQLN